MAAMGVLLLAGVTVGGWWATDRLVDQLARWVHAGRPVYSVEFLNVLPQLTIVEVNCGDGTRATWWSPGVPHLDENAQYRRYCVKPPPSASAVVGDG